MFKPEIILKMKEQFKAELAAYTAYEALKEHVDDKFLIEAFDEIMYDEFLHAKFLRSYMIEMDIYDPSQHSECEKIFARILED